MALESEWLSVNEYESFRIEVQGYSVRQPIDHYVFLDLSLESCLRNVRRRGCAEERTMSLEYLERVTDKHREWRLKMEPSEYTSISMEGVALGSLKYELLVDEVSCVAHERGKKEALNKKKQLEGITR
jgi:deoxyadenosine/deoxycytidine kinase